MADQKNFADGIRFTPPSPKAPTWVKGSISVQLEKFVEWAQQNVDDRGWLNLEVKESKGGKTYVELSTWKPGQKIEGSSENGF